MGRRHIREFVLGVALPAILTAIATISVVFLALTRMSGEINEIDRQHLGLSMQALLASMLSEIGSLTADDAAWTTAYDELYGHPSKSFLTDVFAEGSEPGRPFDSIMVVSASGRIFWAYSNGSSLMPGLPVIDPVDLRAMLSRPEAIAGETVTALANAGGGLKLAGLRVITPNDGVLPADIEPRYLVIARHLDPARLAAAGQPFGISGLTWSSRARSGTVTTPLVSASGAPAGVLACAPRNPGGEAYDRALWMMIIVLAMLVIVVGFLMLTIWKILSAMYAGEEAARRDAYYDALSGLPNRARFNALLADLAHRPVVPVVTVLFADLDGFKEVNDTYGHEVGDRLIRTVAAGFAFLVDGRGLLARLGGDEFAVVLEGYQSMAAAVELGGRMIEFLDQPFDFGDQTVRVGASIGIASSDDEEITHIELVRRADVAMYAAKARGKNRVEFYFAELDADRAEKAELASALRTAIRNDELEVHYQPIVEAATGRIGTVEALVRWIRPGTGPVSPAIFLPVAEEAGLTDLLGSWVLRRVAREAKAFVDCKVAVNVFPTQFSNPLFDENLKTLLEQEQFPPDRLELDVTERLLVAYPERTQRMITALHQLGVHVALDDFGTGFSSINYLRRFGFDKVKIDRSVIIDVVTDPASQQLVMSTVKLADALGVEVTAEGIEKEDEADVLKKAGCHELQGYHFGAPTTAAELLRRLRRDGGQMRRRIA